MGRKHIIPVHNFIEERRGIYLVPEILPKLVGEKIVVDCYVVNVTRTLKTFAVKGIQCVTCGVEGVYFALERRKGDDCLHLNLYGILNNRELLLTRDHILPRSKGGTDALSNLQPMCKICNEKKRDSYA
jgi:hypothetical protein